MSSHRTAIVALVVLLAVVLVVHTIGLFRRSVHWDEFLFLSIIYRAGAGEPVGFLQTSYAYLFGWLTSIGSNELDQVVVGRAVYLFLWLIALAILHRLGCRLLNDRMAALAAILFYALFPFSLLHATSFRIDGLLLPWLLGTALLLTHPTPRRVAAAGLTTAISIALSIKTVLWLPAFAGIFAFGAPRVRKIGMPLLVAIGMTTAALVGIYLLRAGYAEKAGLGLSIGNLRRLAHRMLVEEGAFPNYRVFLESVWSSGVTWLMIAIGGILTAVDVLHEGRRRAALRLLLAASPILSILFYANAWQYAYVVLLPTACLLAGRAFSALLDSKEPVRQVIALTSVAAAAMPLASTAFAYRHDGQADQRLVLEIVHRIFPEPVAYIDKTGMVASFFSSPLPLTGQVIKGYREAGKPVLKNFIEGRHPPLLIANSLVLDVWNGGAESVSPRFRLLPRDEQAIRAAFAHFWGPIYLAGRQWRNLGISESLEFDLVVGGTYTLLADTSVLIDGRLYRPGASVALEMGRHRLGTLLPAETVRLLWGADLKIPPEIPSSKSVFAWYGGA